MGTADRPRPHDRTHRRSAGPGRTKRRSRRFGSMRGSVGKALRRAGALSSRSSICSMASTASRPTRSYCARRGCACSGSPSPAPRALARSGAPTLRRRAQDLSRDPEMWALLGRVDKDAWTAAWDRPGKRPQRSMTTPHTRMRCCAPRSTVTRAPTARTRDTITRASMR